MTTSTAGVTYSYDGDGKRIEKSGSTLYWYGMSGDVLEETNLSGVRTSEYVFFNGERIARYDPAGDVFTYFADHLGSSREVQEVAHGASTATVSYDADFYPFGRENAFTNVTNPIHKFTGKERDSESGLDDFGARYYSSTIGRFMIPDWAAKPTSVPYAEFGNPQSLNLYSYVENNPITSSDPDGHCCDLEASLASWISRGVAMEGGKNFAKDVGTGVAKGAGSFALNTAKSAVAGAQIATGNPVAAVSTLTLPTPAALAPSNETQAQVSTVTQIGLGVATVVAAPGAGSEAGLADDALVVRGGVPTAVQLTNGAETIGADGTLNGISVNSANGATLEQLSQGIPNNQIGVTTVGDVRATGGSVVPSPTTANPCHCDMNGVNAQDASKLFKTQPNPNKVKTPQSQ